MGRKFYSLSDVITQFNLTKEQAVELIHQIPKIDVTRDMRNQAMVTEDGMNEILAILSNRKDKGLGKDIYDSMQNDKTNQEAQQHVEQRIKVEQESQLKAEYDKNLFNLNNKIKELTIKLTKSYGNSANLIKTLKEVKQENLKNESVIHQLKEKNESAQENSSVVNQLQKDKNSLEK